MRLMRAEVYSRETQEVHFVVRLIDGVATPDPPVPHLDDLWVGAPDDHFTFSDGATYLRALPDALWNCTSIGARVSSGAQNNRPARFREAGRSNPSNSSKRFPDVAQANAAFHGEMIGTTS